MANWIPVTEKLPEKPHGCIVTIEEDDHGEPHRVIYNEFAGYDGEGWYTCDGYEVPFEVIAWMPLPKPYKAEREK